MKNKSGFTLIEVLVGISISVILMASVSVFVVNGIKNITFQKNIVKNSRDFYDFYDNLNNNIFLSKNISFININSSSGILFKKGNTLGNGNFSFFGIHSMTGDCLTNTGTFNPHLKIINFTPFERSGYDIFASKSFSGDYLYGTGNNLYVSDPFNHVVYYGDKTNFSATKTVLLGKGVFGSQIDASGTGVYLNNPTGLAYGSGKLFVSDTGNNRILYLSGSNVYTLLDINDGILEPTGLYYESGVLYISNSGKKEILSYISDPTNATSLSMTFTPDTNISSVTNFQINFKDFRGASINVNSPSSNGNFTFSGFSSNPSDIVSTGSSLIYTFNSSKSFTSGNPYTITVSSISGSFLNPGNYYVELFLNGSPTKTFYFPFFTQGTGEIISNKSNNLLKILTGSLSYPTGIFASGSNLIYNDFLDRKFYKIDKSGNFVSSGNLNSFDFNNFDTTKNIISPFVIKDFIYSKLVGFLNLKINYYKNFDCEDASYNLLKTILIKSNLTN